MKKLIRKLKIRHLVYRYGRTRLNEPPALFRRYRLSFWFKAFDGEWEQQSFIRPGFWIVIPRRKLEIPGELTASDIKGYLDDVSLTPEM